MKRYFNILIMASIFFGVVSCGQQKSQQSQGVPSPYQVILVPQQDMVGYTSFPTTVQGKVTSSVRAKISGYIQELYVDEGAKVKAGQPLFRLETNILNENAEAAKAAISTAESQVNVAQVNVNKLVPLVEKGIVSEIQLQTAQADLSSAKSQLASAKANYQSIQANIGYSIIKSPIDGVIGTISFRQGALVGPNDPTPLTVVSDDSEIYAYFSMNEKEYFNFLETIEGSTVNEKLSHLPKVKLFLANDKEYPHEGTIETISGQIDPSTGTVQIRAKFDNPEGLLSTGNSGSIKIPNSYKDMLVVPEASTYERQGEVFVYLIVNNTAISKKIQVVDRINRLALVTEGLALGDTIIGTGMGTIRDHDAIIPEVIDFDEVNKQIKVIF